MWFSISDAAFSISDTAKDGDMPPGSMVFNGHVRATIRQILDDIRRVAHRRAADRREQGGPPVILRTAPPGRDSPSRAKPTESRKSVRSSGR
jgi:ketol-acid reductoisomerase